MSHEITATDSMAYRGETPWHRLGVKLTDDSTAQDFLRAAKLDWKVVRQPVYWEAEDGVFEELPKQYALMREGDSRFFGIASKFRPFQNAEVFDFMHSICESYSLGMETAGSLKAGEIIWALARAPESAEIKGGDRLTRYVLLMNSHRPGVAFSCAETMVRVVCWNTLSVALRQSEHAKSAWRTNHNQPFEIQKRSILDTLELNAESFSAGVEFAREAQTIRLTNQETVDFVGEVCGWKIVEAAIDQYEADKAAAENDPSLHAYNAAQARTGSVVEAIVASESDASSRRQERQQLRQEPSRNAKLALDYIQDSPGADMQGAKGTLWGALNGITYMADHDPTGGDLERRVASVTTGTRAKVKQRAYQTARQMVEGRKAA